jgi:hypothetical protein
MIKMSKWFKEGGFLDEEGEKAFLEIKTELENLLNTDEVASMDVQQLRVLCSCLTKMIGDKMCDKIAHRSQINNQFTAMSDDEFYTYLKEKYGEEVWQFCSLTPEELSRCPTLSPKDFEKIMQENAKNFEFQYPSPIMGVKRF